MYVDQRLMELSEQNNMLFFRFYQWDPVCVSLGRRQNPHNLLNIPYMSSKGYETVNRITGGSFVLHKGDISYAITVPSSNRIFDMPLNDFYSTIHKAFYNALILAGVNKSILSFANGSFSRTHKNYPCFSHNSNHELLLEGKKVLGSAQRRGRHSLLQHGSLLVEDSLEDLFNIQNIYNERSEIFSRVTFLKKFKNIDYGSLYLVILQSLAELLALDIVEIEMEEVVDY